MVESKRVGVSERLEGAMKIGQSGLIILALAVTAPGVGLAQAPKKTPSCEETAQTQSDLTACAISGAQAADRRLNHAYREVLRYVDGDPQAKLVAAERAWIAFRDADCAFWGAGGGTIAPMNEANCRATLSNARAKELDTWPPNAPRDALAPHN
jgi:uncharacterized protein YecT (DUF1311 family)